MVSKQYGKQLHLCVLKTGVQMKVLSIPLTPESKANIADKDYSGFELTLSVFPITRQIVQACSSSEIGSTTSLTLMSSETTTFPLFPCAKQQMCAELASHCVFMSTHLRELGIYSTEFVILRICPSCTPLQSSRFHTPQLILSHYLVPTSPLH